MNTCDTCGPYVKAIWKAYNMNNINMNLYFCNHCHELNEASLRNKNFLSLKIELVKK